jgi:predicted nucleic acid-binding protein
VIIVDTNVWSEPTRASPGLRVLAWLERNHADAAITAINVGELLAGVMFLPDGRRKDALGLQVENLIARLDPVTYHFDVRAARAYASVRRSLRAAGREPFRTEDAMIAAIALAHGASVATLNVGDFEYTGVNLIDPRATN